MTAAVAPQTVKDVTKEFSKNDTITGPKIKDTLTDPSADKTDTDKNDRISKTESDNFIEQNKESGKTIDQGTKDNVWNAVLVEEVAKTEKSSPLADADRKTAVETRRTDLDAKSANAIKQEEAKIISKDDRGAALDKARGELHKQALDLEKKKLAGTATAAEIAEMELLKEKRNKADSIKTEAVLSNGSFIRVNGRAVVELSEDDTTSKTLDGNYAGVYANQKEAYDAYVQQYKTANGKDFELSDTERLIMYRRGDILAYRIIDSKVFEDKQRTLAADNSVTSTDTKEKHRATMISDEITFNVAKPGVYSSGVTMQIATSNPQEPTINRQDKTLFTKTDGKIGFTYYLQSSNNKDATPTRSPSIARTVFDLNANRYTPGHAVSIFRLFSLGTDINDNSFKDTDGDGIPDNIDPNKDIKNP